MIRYVLIPKQVSYNAAFRDRWFKAHNASFVQPQQHWGSRVHDASFTFLQQFSAVPAFSASADTAFFERFFEHMHSEDGQRAWADFVENKHGEARDEVVADFIRGSASIARAFGQYIDADFIRGCAL